MQTALAFGCSGFGCSARALCNFSDNVETCGSCSSAATSRVLGVLWRVLGVLWRVLGVLWRVLGVLWLSEVTTVLTGVEGVLWRPLRPRESIVSTNAAKRRGDGANELDCTASRQPMDCCRTGTTRRHASTPSQWYLWRSQPLEYPRRLPLPLGVPWEYPGSTLRSTLRSTHSVLYGSSKRA